MINAMDAAASSMAGDVARLNTISQNLVNASTTSYKRHMSVSRGFASALEGAAGLAEPADSPASSQAVDHRAGTLRFTGNALDFALEGDGFFEVQTESGIAYTRRGDFRVDALGRLVSQGGHAVQGMGGALQMPNTHPTLDRAGKLLDGDKPVGELKVVRFEKTSQLVSAGEGLFRSFEAPTPVADGAGKVRQGHLEASNVNSAAEMVKLVETMRHFEATQKVVQGVDDMMERALRKLGEF